MKIFYSFVKKFLSKMHENFTAFVKKNPLENLNCRGLTTVN